MTSIAISATEQNLMHSLLSATLRDIELTKKELDKEPGEQERIIKNLLKKLGSSDYAYSVR